MYTYLHRSHHPTTATVCASHARTTRANSPWRRTANARSGPRACLASRVRQKLFVCVYLWHYSRLIPCFFHAHTHTHTYAHTRMHMNCTGTEAIGNLIGDFVAPMAKSVNPERKKAASAVTYSVKVCMCSMCMLFSHMHMGTHTYSYTIKYMQHMYLYTISTHVLMVQDLCL